MKNTYSVVITIVLVVMLIIGSVALFLMLQVFNTLNPDEHELPHDYSFSGTLYGEECTGSGHSEYMDESSNEYDYLVKFSLSSADKSYKSDFMMFFDREDRMLEKYYTYQGKEILDGVETDVWSRDEGGTSYTFYIGLKCKMYKVCIESDILDVIGILKE